jgi:hypothetical protein
VNFGLSRRKIVVCPSRANLHSMNSAAVPSASLPLGRRVLLGVALATVILGGAVLVLTAAGLGHADVRGMRLTGGLRLGFLGGLAVAVLGAATAGMGLVRRRRWAVGLLAAVWPTFALVCLALDRVTPAPGPGRPLTFYLGALGVLPAAATVLLGRSGRTAGHTAPANEASEQTKRPEHPRVASP